jgi:signal transduction histidine kinase
LTQRITNTRRIGIGLLAEPWVDFHLVSAMRVILAASALVLISIDPSEPSRYALLTYLTLLLYTVFSVITYMLSRRQKRIFPTGVMPWLDAGWYLVLIGLSGGASSIFFNLLFFAIIEASFDWGYESGLNLTLASTAVFVAVSLLASTGAEFFMYRPVQLLILGFLISRWGGFKIKLWNRLQLLKDITVFSNPRFGIDRTINAILEKVRAFYDADACLLLIGRGGMDGKSYQLYRVGRHAQPTGASPPEIRSDVAGFFIFPSHTHAVIYREDGKVQTLLFEIEKRVLSAGDPIAGGRVATALETHNYLSVPVVARDEPIGRLYVIGGPTRFNRPALDFVTQLMDHMSPIMENMRLVDTLASDAAELERQRIALDIHDSVIQPYLGLQLALAALAQKLESGNPEVQHDVKRVLELTNQELAEMRRYVWGLRAGEEPLDALLPAIHRYAERFSSVTGINVKVKANGKVKVNGRLAAELFQIVIEGLNNVRRHAHCDDALVEIECTSGGLLLQIKNRRASPSGSLDLGPEESDGRSILFSPRSISERAALLGGETTVSVDENNYTVVRVGIPI